EWLQGPALAALGLVLARVGRPRGKHAAVWLAGGLVAFPTETVYGLGADASSAAAIAKLYAAKGRPPDHPVIVHFKDAASAFEWAASISEEAKKLADKFWPGPLT
ncbi:L-threonylcarbamoyladenylate synthase, partial [Stenotrophomonas sp. 3(2025)]|uniref:L-threonylcarbamoyladenylate synthase n=1 Tax=Stenotrophomonas sp. 3(2025) TaxID=3456023 RepID=UPI004044603A